MDVLAAEFIWRCVAMEGEAWATGAGPIMSSMSALRGMVWHNVSMCSAEYGSRSPGQTVVCVHVRACVRAQLAVWMQPLFGIYPPLSIHFCDLPPSDRRGASNRHTWADIMGCWAQTRRHSLGLTYVTFASRGIPRQIDQGAAPQHFYFDDILSLWSKVKM